MAQILIVEDVHIIAQDLRARLARLGYGVAGIAHSGEEAIRAAEQARPDLVLMDLLLKGDMDGIEAAQRIRQHLQTPVIFVTAHADEETLQRASQTQPSGYILKPFNDHELEETIRVALDAQPKP